MVVVYVALESVRVLLKMLGCSLLAVPRIPFEPGGNSHRGVGQRRNGTVQILQNRCKVGLVCEESQVAAETKTIRPGVFPFQVRWGQLNLANSSHNYINVNDAMKPIIFNLLCNTSRSIRRRIWNRWKCLLLSILAPIQIRSYRTMKLSCLMGQRGKWWETDRIHRSPYLDTYQYMWQLELKCLDPWLDPTRIAREPRHWAVAGHLLCIRIRCRLLSISCRRNI